MRPRALIIGVLVCYSALAIAAALTYSPRADEGFFASPGLNLATKGFMGTTVLEGSHEFLKDIHRYTYWITPLHFLAQAAWYKLAGFSLFRMRMLSLIFGLLALAAWYCIASRLSGNRAMAALTVAIAALDFNFIVGGSSGRMDMMAAALDFSGIAAYLSLRERSLPAAVFSGNALAAAAGLTHPVAGYLAFLAQVFLLLYFDRGRLNLRLLALAAAPYLAGGAAWGVYILKDPAAFAVQFATNAAMSGRLDGLHAPWRGIWRELSVRYAAGYGLLGHSECVSGPSFLKSSMLLLYGAGILGALTIRDVRRHKGCRVLMFLAGIFFLALSVLDSQKAYYYLPHTTPFYAALTSACSLSLMREGRRPFRITAAALAGVLLVQTGGLAYRAWQNPYARVYRPAMAFLSTCAGPADTVFGSASAGFGFGFEKGLVDDLRLGYLTGRKADFVVLDQEYRSAIRDYAASDPKLYAFIERRIATEYVPVYQMDDYTILVSRDRLPHQPRRMTAAPSPSPHAPSVANPEQIR